MTTVPMTTAAGYVPVSSEAELRDLLGEPSQRAVTKDERAGRDSFTGTGPSRCRRRRRRR